MIGIVEYRSNNSGGEWWLKDGDWKALEKAGWHVEWVKDDEFYRGSLGKDGRWLGALAKVCSKRFKTLDEGVAEWEKITGQCADDEGCNCCGNPHDFKFKRGEKTEYRELPDRGGRHGASFQER